MHPVPLRIFCDSMFSFLYLFYSPEHPSKEWEPITNRLNYLAGYLVEIASTFF